MKAPFVVHVPTPTLADQLRLALAREPARVEVQPGEVRVGLAQPDAPPRWLAPVHATDAEDVLAFLQRWGFIARADGAPRA